mmetsp:Transcript_18791/g.27790  ORF Transcript_18791/g.27790 Transcript_18791/m.27790 type:complete len:185 (+) Transcript_18791:118-672(+)
MGFFNGLLKGILKEICLIGIVFYWFPMVWWTYNGMDDGENPPGEDYFMSTRFLMSTGALMTCMGMAYVALPIDLLPDWIPIFGNLDDMAARMLGGAGLMMCYLGYYFGVGDTPEEFETVASVVRTVYYVVLPIWMERIRPVLMPALRAIQVPVVAGSNALLNLLLSQLNDPSITTKVTSMINNG